MTDRAQFEAMLEALINEDQESAKEIFHNIVVSKSREIYEELLAEDFTEDENATSGQAGEEPMGEMFGDEEDTDSEEPADDAEDDGEDDGEENPFGDEESSDSEMDDAEQSDRIMDLEDALEELKAEFEQLMGGDDDMGGADDMGGMDDMGGPEDEGLNQPMFEYVNKVSVPKGGDNGTNTKSIVAGKNNMGGTTANMTKSFSTEKGGTQGGLLKPSTQEENFGNVNVPGGNAGKTGFKKKEPGHGAEKKGAGEKADNTNSMLNGAPKRAK